MALQMSNKKYTQNESSDMFCFFSNRINRDHHMYQSIIEICGLYLIKCYVVIDIFNHSEHDYESVA